MNIVHIYLEQYEQQKLYFRQFVHQLHLQLFILHVN